MTVYKTIRHGAAILAVLMLAACGGGAELGDGGGGGSLGGGTGDSGSSDYKLGNSASGSFANGTIAIGAATIAAGGSTGMSVDIVDKSGALAPGTDASILFSSNCLASGTASITPDAPSLASGRANVTYTAAGCSGSDTITAIVTVDGVSLTAKGTITVQPAELGGLEFVSATPSVIGMAGSPIPSQSVVLFILKDGAGSALPNRTVNLSLSTEVGGTKLAAPSAISDSTGTIRAIVQAGSVHTSVRVKAQITDPSSGQTISSQSEQLVVTTGLPDQNSFSLSATKLAIDGSCDGASTTLNIRAADRYNNPVPQGTAISFTTEGGKVNGQCTTGDPNADPTTEAGVCSVLLNVQNPRPSNGRVTVLATALGEESFTDSNGNGYWDGGELFTNLPEAFVDYDEDGVHDVDEPFTDINNDHAYSGANTTFDGYICDAIGVNCRSNVLNVRDSMVIIFSDVAGNPVVTGVSSPIAATVKSFVNLSFMITDSHGNSLPNGTTYKLEATPGTVLDPTEVGPFNSTNGDRANFRYQAPDTAGAGDLSLTVVIPADDCTGQISVTYHFDLNITT